MKTECVIPESMGDFSLKTFGDEGRRLGALRPQKPLRLIRDGEVGGSGSFISNTCSLHCHHQNDAAIRYVGSCVSHFNASLIVWAKSQDSVHKPQFLKRTESRSGSNQGPFASQPSALRLGHTRSQVIRRLGSCFHNTGLESTIPLVVAITQKMTRVYAVQ